MLSILQTLRDLDSGRLSLPAVYDRVAEAIARREEQVKAFAHLDLAGARRRAASGVGGQFAGLPFAVKDIIDTADMPTAYGSPIYEG